MDTRGRRDLLGRRIREAREVAGLSQRELSLMASTNQSYLWEVETGRVSIGIDVLCRIADALGVRVSDLVEF